MTRVWQMIFLFLLGQNVWAQMYGAGVGPLLAAPGDCPSQVVVGYPSSNMISQVKDMDRIGNELACSEIRRDPNSRFLPTNCYLLKRCSNHKFSKATPSLVHSSLVGKILGEDYAEMILTEKISEMEKVETLKRFAEKNFKDIVPNNCKSSFNYDSKNIEDQKSCRSDLMDAGFLSYQKKCLDGNNCYKGKGEYDSFLSKNFPFAHGESGVHYFFVQKITKTLQKAAGGENEIMKEILSLMKTKESKESKITKLFKKLGELKDRGQLDPALAFGDSFNYYDSEHLNQSKHYAFVSKLFSVKGIKEDQAREQFMNYRKDYVQKSLASSCQDSPRFMDICKMATDTSRSKKVLLDNRDSTLRIEAYPEAERLQALQEALPGVIVSSDDYNLYMDAKRCDSYSLELKRKSDETSIDQELVDSASDRDRAQTYSVFQNIDMKVSTQVIDSLQSPVVSKALIEQSSESLSAVESKSSSSRNTDEVKSQKADAEPETAPTETTNGFSDFAHSAKEQASQSPFPSSDYTHSIPASLPEIKPSLPQAPDKSIVEGMSGNGALNDKISDLTKRLNTAEENLAKMKEEKVQEDKDHEHEQKLAAEKAKVAELSKQIAEAKAQAQKEKAQAISSASSKAASFAPAVSMPTNRSSAYQEQKANADQYRRPSQTVQNEPRSQSSLQGSPLVSPQAPSSAISGSSGRAIASTTASAESAGPKIVLTGLSPEKAREIISAKILSLPQSALLSGAVLDVEEGGVLKQIIPLVVDGKVKLDELGNPMYEKIVRKKLAKGADKTRAPASVVDAADLKRMDEERMKKERSRAEYLKLKKLTEEARDKK